MASEIQLEVIVIRSFGISKSIIASEFHFILMEGISFICLLSKKVIYVSKY